MSEEEKKNRRGRRILVVVVLLLGLVFGAGYFYLKRGQVTTDDAFISGDIFLITPRVAGYVKKVRVSENERVKQGQTLVELDPTELEVAVAEARAQLAGSQATLESLKLGVPLELDQTEQKVRGARAQLESLRRTLEMVREEEQAATHELERAKSENDKTLVDLERMKALRKDGAVSQAAVDDAQTRYQSTLALVRAAEAKRESAGKRKASIQSDMERYEANIKLAATGQVEADIKASEVEAQKAAVNLAMARLKKAELELGYAVITSPAEGYATRKNVEEGQMVSKGRPLMAVVSLDPGSLSVTANLKETQITHVRPGQPVTIKVDAYPGLRLEGTVESIMAGTGSVFSLFPPENASGNYVKVVQRIPVKIALNVSDLQSLPVMRIGMSVVPTIFTDR